MLRTHLFCLLKIRHQHLLQIIFDITEIINLSRLFVPTLTSMTPVQSTVDNLLFTHCSSTLIYLNAYIRAKVVHQAGAYPGFCRMKRLGVFLFPLDGMLVHRSVTSSIKFTGTSLYTLLLSKHLKGSFKVSARVQNANFRNF